MLRIRNQLRNIAHQATDAGLKAYVQRTWKRKSANARPHGLSRPLIVSLTSYPPRFRALSWTLKSLLSQSVRPDRVILWIAHQDKSQLPQEIVALQNRGLQISFCDDIRSYKKIVFALQAFPDGFIVTADDDAYYWRDWLRQLIRAHKPGSTDVLCHRAHQIVLGNDGRPVRYMQWQHDIRDNTSSLLTFPTGLGGVLYPPDSLCFEVVDVEACLRLAPTADDLWLFWMSRRAGALSRKIGPRRRIHNWRGSQDGSLYQVNAVAGDGNDVQVRALIDALGWPPALASQ